MKKIIIFSIIIVALFAVLAIVNNVQNTNQAEGNPFGKKNLHPETIKQLDDPNYQNIILPEELDAKLANKETVTVYYYSPICPACVKTSPIVVPMTNELGIDLKLFNLLEFDQGWSKYNISATPTIVHYIEGEIIGQTEGLFEEEAFAEWFKGVKQTYN